MTEKAPVSATCRRIHNTCRTDTYGHVSCIGQQRGRRLNKIVA